MNNKRLISLTTCWILAVVLILPVLSFAGNESGINKEAQQHFEKANELRKVADYDAAITEYEKAISLSPKSKIAQDAQYWIGQSYFGAGQFDAALSAFQKLLDEYPASPIIPSTKLMMERVEQAKKNKSLFEAVTKGDIEQVKKLIAQGADVNVAEGENAWTPLLAAAKGAHSEVVKVLLANGANVNLAETYGYTALYYAIWNDDEETVKSLISGGADVNKGPAEEMDDDSPLCYAIWQRHAGIVKDVLDAGADINTKDEKGYTPLYWAAFSSSKDILDLILSRGKYNNTIHLDACKGDMDRVTTLIDGGTDVNTKDEFGCTPLHWAALADSPEVAGFLIAKGADVNAKHGRGYTPLLSAHALPVVELLVSNGADIHARLGEQGPTKLQWACGLGEADIVDFLLSKSDDVSLKDKNGGALLTLAARYGHTDVVKLLIAKGADVNVTDNRGRTPLAMARQGKHAEVVNILRQHGAKESLHDVMPAGDINQIKRLISEGADVNAKDGKGQTPLHVAVLNGRKDIVELLIANGADINVKSNTWDTTPLIAAIKNGQEDIAKMLIVKGADVNGRGRGDYTPLHCAAMNRAKMTGSTEIMNLLLARGADIEARQEHDATPLACATYDGNTESTKFLIEHGANIEARTHYDRTPLLRAVGQEYVATAKLLLDKGANIDATWRGLSAIHVAMLGDRLSNRKSGPEMVKLLIEQGLKSPPIHLAAYLGDLQKVKGYVADGTDIDEKDAVDFTPLHCAVCGDHMDVVKFLLSKGAGVNAKTVNGWTPLAFVWPVDMAALLIANGADVRIADEQGQTALHWAVNRDNHRGDKALIELLLKHGADINARAASTSGSWAGWTPLHVACGNGNPDIVGLLLAHGADVNAKSDKGETPLAIAQNNGHRQVVELLKEHGAKE